ncbi:hypothetical protein [Botrimarina sp.]|uniref:hypothetical protein n=1 Tax=Botrimarina sp. TaxID=2795802 RepID=UPI0032EC4D36
MTTASLLDRVFDPLADALTPEAAARIVQMRADDAVQNRIDHLAEKCNEGLLSEEEQREYDAYIQAIDLISIVQSKARQVLKRDPT